MSEVSQTDWQTWAALAVVALTAAAFIARSALRKKKDGGCGHDCGCTSKGLLAQHGDSDPGAKPRDEAAGSSTVDRGTTHRTR